MKFALRVVCVAALALVADAQQSHQSGLTAQVAFPDGTTRLAKLDGLGCTGSICSRVQMKGWAGGESMTSFWLDSIASIRPLGGNEALLVMKDGTEQRFSLVTDFRVLYLSNSSGKIERLDLAKIKSLDFIP